MKKSIAFFVCKYACILLGVFVLTGLAIPISHAAIGSRMRKSSTMNAIQVTGEQQLAQQAQRPGVVVALVYLPTCSACLEAMPQYENMANTYSAMTYLQVDINTIPNVVAQLHIVAVPTFILYKNGVVIQTLTTTDLIQLQNAIQQNL
jgi:thioredoxin-like negative regulator of GroEL